MARKLRLEYPGACYHVINRGNYRRSLFAGKGAAEAFERVLLEAAGKFGWRLHAWVIMRNHFHLAVETPEPNLSLGMKWLQGTWAARFNRWQGEVGRPFQGRYKALHVEPGHALAQVAHYIHLNPARAKVVPVDRLGEFRWSSLHHFRQKPKARPACLMAATVLTEAGGLPDTTAGWHKYGAYLAVLAEESPKRRQERFGELSRGWYVGSEEFRASLRQKLRTRGAEPDRTSLLGVDRKIWRAERAAEWEEKLRQAAQAMGIDLARLPERKSAPDKVRLAAVMKTGTGASNGWLAERLGMGKPASVSQFVRRYLLADGTKPRSLQAGLSRVKT
jgi:REP element-mobilizing transposase RayT